MWARLSKYFALRNYRKKLGPALAKRYGRQRHYTANQVRATVDTLGLDRDYLCYGLAGFCERWAFDRFHESLGETCDWVEMREAAAHEHIGVHSHGYGEGFAEVPDTSYDDNGHHHHSSGHHHGSGHGHDGGGHHF